VILPTKGIAPDRALITIGGELLRLLDEPKTISRLWSDVTRKRSTIRETISFDWFVLALDFLFAAKAVDLVKGRLDRTARAPAQEPLQHAKEPVA